MQQPGRQRADRSPGATVGVAPAFQPSTGGDLDRRQQILVRLGQDRVGADLAALVERRVAARGERQRQRARDARGERGSSVDPHARYNELSDPPSQALTASSTIDDARQDRVPCGTTAVQPSRLWTKALTQLEQHDADVDEHVRQRRAPAPDPRGRRNSRSCPTTAASAADHQPGGDQPDREILPHQVGGLRE